MRSIPVISAISTPLDLDPLTSIYLHQLDELYVVLLFKVFVKYWRKLALINPEELDQDVVGCRNHNILPESQVSNPLPENNAS